MSIQSEDKKDDLPVEDEVKTPNFFNWRDVYPELEVLYQNQHIIRKEINNIEKWIPWPEDHFGNNPSATNNKDWTVFPLLHTFPAFDSSKSQWVPSTCSLCPKTVNILKTIPTLRTALFSKLGPNTKLSSHTGWADLANYVLRCHLCLDIPGVEICGLLVDGEVQYHKQGQIIVFDDSKPHRAFNFSEIDSRIVLIVDLARPSDLPIGTAKGGHTSELDNFIDLFK